MPNITQNIPNLVNGVSQQAPTLRLDTQGEEQINAYSSVVGGLQKRPPGVYLRQVPSAPDAFTTLIDRPSGRFLVTIRDVDGTVTPTVSWLDGATDQPLETPNGLGYLQCDNPATELRCVTVGDSTIIVNRTVHTDMATDLTDALSEEALITVRTGKANTTYSVLIDGIVAARYTTTTDAATYKTEAIADALFDNLTSGTVDESTTTVIEKSKSGYRSPDGMGGTVTTVTTQPSDLDRDDLNFVLQGSTIHAYSDDDTAFTITVLDTEGDSLTQVIRHEIDALADLPSKAPDGYKVKITGDGESEADDHWVVFAGDDSDSPLPGGQWEESLGPGIKYKFNPGLMPHILYPDPGVAGGFIFGQITWPERTAGDDDMAPVPSFIGKRIEDVTYHLSRLCFVSDINLHFSAVQDLFNMFRTTVTDLLDDDPIDVEVASSQGSTLRNAVRSDRKLIIFSDREQFVVEGNDGEPLTPSTISANAITAFNSNPDVRPMVVGRYMYFPFDRGNYSGLREYLVPSDIETFDAADITAHVAKYIHGNVRQMAATTNEDLIAVRCDEATDTVYLYKYFRSGNEKIQSSWSKLVFGAEVRHIGFIGSDLYVAVGPYNEYDEDDEATLIRLPFAVGEDIDVYLDRRITEADCVVNYNEEDDQTSIALPYAPENIDIVVREGGVQPEGTRVPVEYFVLDEKNVVVDGDYSSEKFFIGERYSMLYEFSTFYVKQRSQSGGSSIVPGGRLQVRRIRLVYDETGNFTVTVKSPGRDDAVQTFTGRILGSANNLLGLPAVESGEFSMGVGSDNKRVRIIVENDSHLPSNFTSASWEAAFNRRSTDR